MQHRITLLKVISFVTRRCHRLFQLALPNHFATSFHINHISPVVTIRTIRSLHIHNFYVLPTQCIYVFCVDLRINSDYFPIQHWLTGLYNRDGVCLLRGTDWIFIYNSTFFTHSVIMCFVWIWEQTAIISLYSINWLVFITETECVYFAVRTGCLYIILRSAHTVYLCVLCGSENKQRLFPYTALTVGSHNRGGECLQRCTD